MVAGRQSAERLSWQEDQKAVFEKVKLAITKLNGIFCPHPDDVLHTFSDFSQSNHSIGGRMEAWRKLKNGSTVKLPAGYFSVMLDKHKANWLPCEGEALGCKLILEHFAPS